MHVANSKLHADVLIVTVTAVERNAVLAVFQGGTRRKAQPVSIQERIYFDLGEVKDARVFMAMSEMGAGGPGAAQQTVGRGIRALAPSAVIMAGIAFGVDETKQSIGDVLVSEHIRLYELQRVGTKRGGPRIILRGDRSPASIWLLNRMKAAEVSWRGATLRFGVVLTGEKLVDNLDFRTQLLGFEPEAIGGEMEGAGLYTACQDCKVDWILVKGICDWADGNKERDREASQQTAAHNAARFALHALTFTPFYPPEPPLLSKRPRRHKPSASVRSTLPPQPHFFGRKAELETILDAYCAGIANLGRADRRAGRHRQDRARHPGRVSGPHDGLRSQDLPLRKSPLADPCRRARAGRLYAPELPRVADRSSPRAA